MTSIIFDLDGTLLELNREYEDIIRSTFHNTVGYCKDEWIDNYNRLFFEKFNNMVKNPYYKAISELNIDYPTHHIVKELQNVEFNSYSIPKNLKSILHKLTKNGFKLGILTNGVSKWQKKKIQKYELNEYFNDNIFISYSIGFHKPNRNIYRYVENKMDTKSYTMISDSYSDLRGARVVGWNGFVYNKHNNYKKLYEKLEK